MFRRKIIAKTYNGGITYLLNLRITTLQLCAVLAAMLLYGALGQPTPDQLGITEIVIALLLIAGAGAQGASNLFILTPRQQVFARPAWFNAVQILAKRREI